MIGCYKKCLANVGTNLKHSATFVVSTLLSRKDAAQLDLLRKCTDCTLIVRLVMKRKPELHTFVVQDVLLALDLGSEKLRNQYHFLSQ